ncbi:hypothetical protein [Flavilitoribacter nigricans]|uniref:Uncharacterized protein n=1 Tax=Flavilitoribacter nigricans (strain ATCC 23147 / DSM 23189 / NBRC 102662 / NCIMB 1420 / SS-2) TaxID=1122177 RepID=A0A2D0N2Q4_FLAN2|nr:hypothetical protein [Flavilitoribacter nigricans]PHN02690.1 hypothetical protein CRP01_30365 [Flavilitoribacter nigricans DSM 23189 = NBRC 102662]
MKPTPTQDSSFVFTSAFLILMSVLLLLAFPLLRSAVELIQATIGDFLAAFGAELGRSYGR